MPDPVRVAATEKVTYDGAFRPSFFNGEMFCALGLTIGDLVDNAKWFSTAEAYRKWLDVAREEIKDAKDAGNIFTLGVYDAGVRYGDRCNITLRIPEEWPAHHLMYLFLEGSNKFNAQVLNKMTTCNDQLNALKTLSGWHDVHTTDLIKHAFASRVSNALELIYFGVDAKKVWKHHHCIFSS
jgi:hypothetical protein